jgi:molybdopterin-guanine dinucleotide biosynthesis protein A
VKTEKPAGVILAGGSASRIGGEKASLPFLSGTLLDAVIARVSGQVHPLALNIRSDEMQKWRARHAEFPLLLDSFAANTGPLAGVIAGLAWLETLPDAQWLATFPCDTPFLPLDLVEKLMTHARGRPVVARDALRMHGVCGVWPLSCAPLLRERVELGKLRSVQSALDALGGDTYLIEADEHAFFNVNTKEDLALAARLARSA